MPDASSSRSAAGRGGTVDVIVVGAGLAGLCAARRLLENGRSVVVLEARDRVGGRTLTQKVGGDPIDLGGQWVGPTQNRIARLARELGVQTHPQFDEGRHVMDVNGTLRTYKGTIPSLPVLSLLEVQWAITLLERYARQISTEKPWTAARAAEWDAISVEGWSQRHLWTEGARAALGVAVRAVFSAEPSELSFLYLLFYIRSGGGLMKLCDVKGGAQQDCFIGGSQQISTRLAEKLGEHVKLSSPIYSVAQDESGVTIESDSGTWRGRYAVLAIPPHFAARLRYSPDLPATRDQLTQRMPIGASIKCIAFYDRPFWREKGYSGATVSTQGPIHFTYDDCSHDGKRAALVGFILGNAARYWSGRPDQERRGAVLADFARLLGPEAQNPSGYVDKDWNADPWIRGCSVGLMASGAMTSCGPALREPIGRLHWAGTETATEWAGFMDGAVESGERAAREVLERGD